MRGRSREEAGGGGGGGGEALLDANLVLLAYSVVAHDSSPHPPFPSDCGSVRMDPEHLVCA